MMISVKNLSFSYDARPILSDISFKLNRGRILGILGPNGAGKSTLLKLLNQRLQPANGEIKIDGKNINHHRVNELAQTVATVHQTSPASFGFTIEELVRMGRRPYLGPFDPFSQQDHALVEQALEAVNLAALRNRPITHLSGGELQLAHVAKALAQTPKLLLMDEATASLDIQHTSQILRLVRQRVQQDQLTVAAVIHDINLAVSFCDEILFVAGGKAHGPAAPAELITAEKVATIYGIERERITVHTNPYYLECRL